MRLAEWTTAYMNDLPNSAFLYIAPGGEEDDDGRTVPRSLRYFPYRDAEGKVDLPHLRNAIAQAPKADLGADIIARVQAKGRKILDDMKGDDAEEDMAHLPDKEEDEAAPDHSYSEWSSVVRLSDVAKWVELARSGSHFGRASERRVDLSAEDINSMARGYRVIQTEGWFPTGAPVGYNHATISGALDPESTKAAGRILDVRVEDNGDGVSLMGLVRWTEEARRRIQAGEFDGFSIEAIPASSARSKKTGEGLGEWALIGGTLTNEPFVPGLARVAATEQRKSTMSLSRLLSDTLRLDEGASDAQILAKVQSTSEAADKVEALSEALASVTADRDAVKAELDALEAKETERLLDRACEDGRIAASERDRYLRILTTLGEEEVNYAYPKDRLSMKAVGAAGVEADRRATSVCAEVETLADRLAEADGLDPVEAYGRAMQIVLSDPTKSAAYEAESLN